MVDGLLPAWIRKPGRKRQEITMYNVLGEGDCAIVYRARWRGLDAVAKMLKSTSEYKDDRREDMARADLMHEISVISHLR